MMFAHTTHAPVRTACRGDAVRRRGAIVHHGPASSRVPAHHGPAGRPTGSPLHCLPVGSGLRYQGARVGHVRVNHTRSGGMVGGTAVPCPGCVVYDGPAVPNAAHTACAAPMGDPPGRPYARFATHVAVPWVPLQPHAAPRRPASAKPLPQWPHGSAPCGSAPGRIKARIRLLRVASRPSPR